ncbi:MAG TPA: alpha/beta fold hydrolase [Candidatus Nitrosocosmicus sp.]|nr:alpha/beta fold hydrolase [Candidatus Nitrosocosmicus sp.]
MKRLYPPIEPYNIEYLKVSDIHTLYMEETGNPNGIPVIYLHGGPGSQSKSEHRRFFNPKKYRIILYDQRGCGKSTPLGELKENTTQHLIEDIERIRKYLHINLWIIYGRSWGSTLSIAYAEKYSQYIKAIIIGGVFTARKKEIDWFTQDGANLFFTDAWEEMKQFISQEEYGDMVKAFYTRVMSNNKKIQLNAINVFSKWDRTIATLLPKNLTN